MTRPPIGLLYRAEIIEPREEVTLLERVARLEFREVVMRGRTAHRTVVHMGYDYSYTGGAIARSSPLPEWLLPLRVRAAELVRVRAEKLVQALITRYPAGAAIGWHRDANAFEHVVGVSLLAACTMRFRRQDPGQLARHDLELPERSGYALTGEVRERWQHSIPPLRSLRYSITFRSLR
jgi:alkylated DNA repair protein (DNA oxidative demethylase)